MLIWVTSWHPCSSGAEAAIKSQGADFCQVHYWSTEDSQVEVDFIFQQGSRVCPLEAKSEDNVRSRSLRAYERRFSPERAYRASMMPYIVQQVPLANGGSCELVNFPLYAIGTIG